MIDDLLTLHRCTCASNLIDAGPHQTAQELPEFRLDALKGKLVLPASAAECLAVADGPGEKAWDLLLQDL